MRWPNFMTETPAPTPRSLVWTTDIDVLPRERILERRTGYLVVRSPGNPGHYWGNQLLFDEPPRAGDGERWEALFAEEFAGEQRVRHVTFAWDRSDGSIGAAQEEFVQRGYLLEATVGLIADVDRVRAHARESREVLVRALDHQPGADADLWEQVVGLQVAGRDESFPEDVHRDFCRARIEELRQLFRAGRGSWYVALDASGTEVQGSCGVVVTGTRGRFQSVDTAERHRRKGICSRLVVDAARSSATEHGAERLVICADPEYHALGLYESLGFEPVERVTGVIRRPPENSA
jgi:ribosomal protein S18 acetylase RimI-like enzyme